VYLEEYELALLPEECFRQKYTQFVPIDKEALDSSTRLDYVVTMGGDGTVLHTLRLIETPTIPPLITFAMGTVSYLCQFDISEMKEVINAAIFKVEPEEKLILDYRMRLQISFDTVKALRGKMASGAAAKGILDEADAKDFHALNEVAISRVDFLITFSGAERLHGSI